MSEQITLTLPAEVVRLVEAIARRAGRPVEDLLAESIESSFQPLADSIDDPNPEQLSNEEVQTNANVQMPPAEDQRLSELLARQSQGMLLPKDQGELAALMGIYQRLLLRKAQALREAVRRGLRGPVEP